MDLHCFDLAFPSVYVFAGMFWWFEQLVAAYSARDVPDIAFG